jgi:hypothetical protein
MRKIGQQQQTQQTTSKVADKRVEDISMNRDLLRKIGGGGGILVPPTPTFKR